MAQYFEKDPNAIADYQVDWSAELGATDTIGTATWTFDSGITSGTASFTTTATTIWLAGGVAGVVYHGVNHITTAGGRQFDKTIIINVKQDVYARRGMYNLINRVRALTGAGTAEYSVGDLTYWSNEQIQDVLDSNGRLLVDLPLTWRPQSIGGGTVTYIVADVPYRDLEEAASGTSRWVVRDGPGAVVGTATYTPDYRSGQITFTSSQGGTAYYLTGYSYDVNAAAADLWLERLTHFNEWYDFSADNQSFSRSQAWEHALKAESLLRGKAGANVAGAASGDVRMGQFVRVDLNQ